MYFPELTFVFVDPVTNIVKKCANCTEYTLRGEGKKVVGDEKKGGEEGKRGEGKQVVGGGGE